VELQAEAMGIPLLLRETEGQKEEELKDLISGLKDAIEVHKIEGVVTGALYSNYQRERIEKVCEMLNLKVLSPLWHINQETELLEILASGFELIFTRIAAEGLDKSWLGTRITEFHIARLRELNHKYGLNIAGEGGEYESLVLNCPIFKKKLETIKSEIIEENPNAAVLNIISAQLVDKQQEA
jgi:asparagine synthase (glutamine-hydrolysing)